MEYNTSELCDLFADNIDVVDPIFTSYGGRYSFGGEITTIKCYEDRSLIDRILSEPGEGKVLLIDGGGSLRRALFDTESAQLAIDNNWEGVVCYGSVRDVDSLAEYDLGILAVGAIPVNAESSDVGEVDIAVNFGGVTFLPEDHIYADSTGVILSAEPLDID